MRTDLQTEPESVALALAIAAMEIGVERFVNRMYELLTTPLPGTSLTEILIPMFRQEILQRPKGEEKLQRIQKELETVDRLTSHFTPTARKWLHTFMLPAIVNRDTNRTLLGSKGNVQEIDYTPLVTDHKPIVVQMKLVRKLRDNTYTVHFTFQGGQQEWAIFWPEDTTKRKANSDVTSIYAGEMVTFRLEFQDDNAKDIVEKMKTKFFQCNALVTRTTLRKRSAPEPSDIHHITAAVIFPSGMDFPIATSHTCK